jgi:hypothetical protein
LSISILSRQIKEIEATSVSYVSWNIFIIFCTWSPSSLQFFYTVGLGFSKSRFRLQGRKTWQRWTSRLVSPRFHRIPLTLPGRGEASGFGPWNKNMLLIPEQSWSMTPWHLVLPHGVKLGDETCVQERLNTFNDSMLGLVIRCD